MKKRDIIGILIVLVLFMGVIGSVNLVSAGWWAKITGKDTVAIDETEEFSPTDCISEGEKGTIFNDDFCCEGLVKIANSGGENCLAPNDGSFICAKPGDGICGIGENECNSPQDCTCNEGETKKYTCPDGIKVDWCICQSDSIWVCVGSPENACSSTTCSMPWCGESVDPYFTGNYDENDCPIYECLGMTCSPGIGEELVCSDGTSVPSCHCTDNGEWECIENPENQCPEITCPEGCICNDNTVACFGGQATGETATIEGVETVTCPIGCICTEETMVCESVGVGTGEGCAIGCKLDETCVLPGIRTSVDNVKKYCDIDSQWKKQKNKEECDNNFECKSNLCIDSVCVSSGLWQKIMSWFGNLFGV